MKRLFVLPLVVLMLLASSARADGVQTKGPELFPGKLQLGVTVIGFQAGFLTAAASGYKLTADFSGLIAQPKFGGLWLGGGINYTFGFFNCAVNGACAGDLQLWAFVMLTFEKLIPIPLVPFVRAGLGGDVEFFPGAAAGAFIFRFGGGVHYYVLKWLGVGIETNFTLGPGFYGNAVINQTGTGFYGTWDFGIGARFAF